MLQSIWMHVQGVVRKVGLIVSSSCTLAEESGCRTGVAAFSHYELVTIYSSYRCAMWTPLNVAAAADVPGHCSWCPCFSSQDPGSIEASEDTDLVQLLMCCRCI